MKKLILLLYTFSVLIVTGCYDQSGTATVRITLGNIPITENQQKLPFSEKLFNFFIKSAYAQSIPGNIIRIHVSAIKDGKLIAKDSYVVPDETGSGAVEFSVPAGDNISIVAAAENDLNEIEFFGYTVMNLTAGETSNADIYVYDNNTLQTDGESWSSKINIQQVTINNEDFISWNSPGVKVKYHLYENRWDGNAYVPVKLYEGYGFSVPVSTGYWFFLYLEFEGIGIKSIPIELNNG